MTKLSFVARTVNRLKRRYGVRVDFYRPTTNSFDPITGQLSRSYETILVMQALVLPTKINQDFDYDLSFIAANKNFTFGGLFNRGLVTLCISFKDFKGYRPQTTDFMVYLGRRWEIKEVDEFADAQCFQLIIQECKTSKEFFVNILQRVGFIQEGLAEL